MTDRWTDDPGKNNMSPNSKGEDIITETIQPYQRMSPLSNLFSSSQPGSSVRCTSAWHEDGCAFDPRVRQHTFVEVGHEIIQVGQ